MIRLLSTLVRLGGDILRTLTHILQLLQELGPPNCQANQQLHLKNDIDLHPQKPDRDAYTDDELCTVKEACVAMNVSRSTIDRLRDNKELSSPEKNGRVRLVKAEIEEAKIWYSRRKGKL